MAQSRRSVHIAKSALSEGALCVRKSHSLSSQCGQSAHPDFTAVDGGLEQVSPRSPRIRP